MQVIVMLGVKDILQIPRAQTGSSDWSEGKKIYSWVFNPHSEIKTQPLQCEKSSKRFKMI